MARSYGLAFGYLLFVVVKSSSRMRFLNIPRLARRLYVEMCSDVEREGE